MLAEGACVDVSLVAHGADVGALARVRAHVALQGAGVGPRHATGQTLEGFHTWRRGGHVTSRALRNTAFAELTVEIGRAHV